MTPYTPAGRQIARKLCAPQLLLKLCGVRCVWGGHAPPLWAPSTSARPGRGVAVGLLPAQPAAAIQNSQVCAARAQIEPRRGGSRWCSAPGQGTRRCPARRGRLPERLPALPLCAQLHHAMGTRRAPAVRGWRRTCGARLSGPPPQPCRSPPGRRRPPAQGLDRCAPRARGRDGCTGGGRIPGPLSSPGLSAGASLCPWRLQPSRRVPTVPGPLVSYCAASLHQRAGPLVE